MTDIQKVEAFLEELLSKMGFENFVVDVKETDNDLLAEITTLGKNNVIGYRGELLDAIQYLTGLALNGQSSSHHKRVVVNSENYRQKREKALQQLAKNLEQKVKRTQKATKLEPMNSAERRIIHTTLQGSQFVTTESEGSEPNRYVVVSPTLSLANEQRRKNLTFVYRSDKKKRR
ncbi:MAG: KH domain-containing protein [Clostridia bacterium]|nr:KH domain-containing protein [Clostridia bacterium]